MGSEGLGKKSNRKYDVAIINGEVIDVINNKIEKKNIGIDGDKIVKITKDIIEGKTIIDAAGLMVSPGFIDFHSHVDGNPYSAECLVKQGGTTTLGGERNLNGHVIKKIAEEGFIINHGFFISHSFALRTAAGITDPYYSASPKELNFMEDLAERFMENGAFGITFGLEFAPGTSSLEIINLAKVAKKYNRLITVHLRKDGLEALQYFDEIVKTAEITGVSIQILQLMYMVGIGGAMEKGLSLIEEAIGKGLDITADSGVYDAYSACIGTSIFDPGWEQEYGDYSVNDLLITSGFYMGEHCSRELFDYLRKEYPSTLVTAFVCDSDAIITAMKKPYVYISTNAADGPHYPEMGAPEVSGTFPRLIGRYVREKKAIGLLEAIKKITILPAKRFGIEGKGCILEEKDADLVIFDYERIIDKAEYMGQGSPDAPPEGIKYVLVNGKIIVEGNKVTGKLHEGKLLRRI